MAQSWLFMTPWTTACLASLSFTNSQSLIKQVCDLTVPLYLRRVVAEFCSREWSSESSSLYILFYAFVHILGFNHQFVKLSYFATVTINCKSNRNSNRNLLFLLTVRIETILILVPKKQKHLVVCLYMKMEKERFCLEFLIRYLVLSRKQPSISILRACLSINPIRASYLQQHAHRIHSLFFHNPGFWLLKQKSLHSNHQNCTSKCEKTHAFGKHSFSFCICTEKPPGLWMQLCSLETELQKLITMCHLPVAYLIVHSLWHSTCVPCELWKIGKREIISTSFPHQENTKYTSKLVCPSHTVPGCYGLPLSLIHLSWGKNVKIARKGTTTDYKRVINANRFLDKVILKPKQRL